MSIHRRNPRRDNAEPGIVRALTALGCSVQPLSGRHVPDLLVGFRGQNILLECKAPLGPGGGKSGRELTDGQRVWHATWRGSKPFVVRTSEDAIAAVMSAGGIHGRLHPVSTAWGDASEPTEAFPGQDPEAAGFGP